MPGSAPLCPNSHYDIFILYVRMAACVVLYTARYVEREVGAIGVNKEFCKSKSRKSALLTCTVDTHVGSRTFGCRTQGQVRERCSPGLSSSEIRDSLGFRIRSVRGRGPSVHSSKLAPTPPPPSRSLMEVNGRESRVATLIMIHTYTFDTSDTHSRAGPFLHTDRLAT